MKMILFLGVIAFMVAAGLGFLISGHRTLRRVPVSHVQTRMAANRRILIGLLLILLGNLIFRAVPQEWILGPPPSAEPGSSYTESESVYRNTEQALEQYANEKADELGIGWDLKLAYADLPKDS